MKNNKVFLMVLAIISFSGMIACKKSGENLYIPETQAHFLVTTASGTYLTNAQSSYKLGVGSTTVGTSDATYTVKVISPSGAVEGTHYTFGKKTVTIPANKAVSPDSIEVKAVNSFYTAGRKDTLKLILEQQTGKDLGYLDTFVMVIRNCNDLTDINATSIMDLKGTYAHTNELYGTSPYGPYTTTVSSVTITSPTTATIAVTNIWDNGWGPISFTLDWTNPANRTITAIAQTAISGSNAGDLSTTYAGLPIAERQFTGNLGTFSLCNQTLVLKMQLGVGGATVLGYFASLYQVTLAR